CAGRDCRRSGPWAARDAAKVGHAKPGELVAFSKTVELLSVGQLRPRPFAVIDVRGDPSEHRPNPSLHVGLLQLRHDYGMTSGDAACGRVEGGSLSRTNPRLAR